MIPVRACLTCGHPWLYHFDYDEEADRYMSHPCDHWQGCDCKHWTQTSVIRYEEEK